MSVLEQILLDVRREIEEAKQKIPPVELHARLVDAPPVRPFAEALASEFGLIAEVKACSPSMGPMRAANVREAATVYRNHPLVRAVSLLTNRSHFGMDIKDFQRLQAEIGKPALRKDFIIDPYQIVEARVHGADAILLMSQHLRPVDIHPLAAQAQDLGMDVLLECFTRQHIEQAPDGVRIIGINSRDFSSGGSRYRLARWLRRWGRSRDFTTNLDNFEKIRFIPPGKIRIAESGISPETLPRIAELGFNAALIGTSLLLDPRGVEASLQDFASRLPVPAS